MANKKMKIGISLTIHPDLLKQLDEHAEKERRNRSQMIAVLIERYLISNQSKQQ